MKRTHNGRAGSITVAWRPVSSSRISLPIEMHSLFLITRNLSLWRRKRWGILDQIAHGESDIDKFPCIFPIEQGSAPGDEFAPNWFHRHLVCSRGDFRCAARVRPRNSRDSAGIGRWARVHPNRRLRVPGLEDAAVGVRLCCLVGRFGFALPNHPEFAGGSNHLKDGVMANTNKFSREIRERTVRTAFEHRGEYASGCEAMASIASKISCTAETLRSVMIRSCVASERSLKSLSPAAPEFRAEFVPVRSDRVHL
jgi:hypothetical protein